MKKLLVMLVVGLFVAAASNCFAQAESEVFYWDDIAGTWVANPQDMEERNARLFRGGDDAVGNCNKKFWDIPVEIHASIAQWVDFDLAWTQWQWYIRKPGCFAGNSIEATIASNGDIYIDYEGFENLMPVGVDDQDHNPIPVWYSFDTGGGVGEAEANGWVSALEMNVQDSRVLDLAPWDLHTGISWKLWNKICVEVCNSACDYADFATITITLENQKDWIVWDTGEWGL